MTDNRITDGVGKKIVEALKMQSESNFEVNTDHLFNSPDSAGNSKFDNIEITESPNEIEENISSDNGNFSILNQALSVEQKTPEINIQIQPQMFNTQDFDDSTMPMNIVILKQLLTKLPVGVTKQTGALIIRQTMEALGTSMKDVLKEAQQFQDSISTSTKECQETINEHKKQIDILEKQVKQYQKQYAMLNDVISLFVQVR